MLLAAVGVVSAALVARSAVPLLYRSCLRRRGLRFEDGTHVPYPSASFPFGNVDRFSEGGTLRAILELEEITNANPHGMASIWLMGEQVLLVTHKEHIAQVFAKTTSRKIVPAVTIHTKETLGEHSIVSLNDREWSHTRGIIKSILNNSTLPSYFNPISSAAVRFTDELWPSPATTESVNVYEDVKNLTMRVICEIAFSDPHSEETASFSRLFELMLEVYNERQLSLNPLNLLYKLPTEKNRKRNAARDTLRAILRRVIDRRIEHPHATPTDALDRMLAIHADDVNEPRVKEYLIDNLLTLVFAGFDTTAVALTGCLHFLAKHKAVQNKVVKELSTVLGGAPVTRENQHRLVYLRKVILETLRLMPPAPVTTRLLTEDLAILDEHGDVIIHVKAGTQVWVPIVLTHRSRHNFPGPDPLAFVPERWNRDPSSSVPVNEPISIAEATARGFYAFSGGARQCPGKELALMEIATVLATCLQTIDVSPTEGSEMALGRCAVVLSLENGCSLDVTERKSRDPISISSVEEVAAPISALRNRVARTSRERMDSDILSTDGSDLGPSHHILSTDGSDLGPSHPVQVPGGLSNASRSRRDGDYAAQALPEIAH